MLPELETMFRVALAMTRNRAEAEDLVQDTLLRAFQAIERFDGRHPRAWLLTILRNTQINRHRRRRPGLLRDWDGDQRAREPASTDSGPEETVMATMLDFVVEAAFSALPDHQQIVIWLVDVDGLSYREAAEVLAVPIGTVMSRLHRGRKRIMHQLVGSEVATGRIS